MNGCARRGAGLGRGAGVNGQQVVVQCRATAQHHLAAHAVYARDFGAHKARPGKHAQAHQVEVYFIKAVVAGHIAGQHARIRRVRVGANQRDAQARDGLHGQGFEHAYVAVAATHQDEVAQDGAGGGLHGGDCAGCLARFAMLSRRLRAKGGWGHGRGTRYVQSSPTTGPHPMSIKSDKWIRRMAESTGMIEPFEPGQVRQVEGKKIISYGTSSYGYDIRCAPEFKVFTNIHSTVVDPKNFDEKSFVDFNDDVCIIPPNSFALARTLEYFRIPRNVLTICLGKSTYARCGIIVNVTPFEPEWEGYVTLEFSNTTPLPAKIYAGEGCAQVLFFESDEVCETSYKDRGGKYQGQTGVTLPKT